jgi:hypothetical protein
LCEKKLHTTLVKIVLQEQFFCDLQKAKSGNATSRAGEMISLSRELLHYWELNTLLPLDKALTIYIDTGEKVSVYELRPGLKNLIKKVCSIVC